MGSAGLCALSCAHFFYMTFDQLGLAPALLKAVQNEGYTEPTLIQQQAIPAVIAGRDLLAGSQTGSGKTAALKGMRVLGFNIRTMEAKVGQSVGWVARMLAPR